MKAMNFQGKWIVVTGASSGLGKEMAVQLARDHGANLVLVARRVPQLNALQKDLQDAYGVQVEVISADLSQPGDVDAVYEQAISGRDIYGVILNAGVTFYGRHQAMDWCEFQTLLSTNLTSVVRLTGLFTQHWIQKQTAGGIMLVTSMAGLLPVPYQSAYAGSKAFVTHFGQSLYHEHRKDKFSITVFAPGGIHTEMNQSSGLADHFGDSVFIQSAQVCAKAGLNAMKHRRYLVVPGVLNNIQLILSRFVPRRWIGGIAARAYAGGVK